MSRTLKFFTIGVHALDAEQAPEIVQQHGMSVLKVQVSKAGLRDEMHCK